MTRDLRLRLTDIVDSIAKIEGELPALKPRLLEAKKDLDAGSLWRE
jgi:hypothetical protein